MKICFLALCFTLILPCFAADNVQMSDNEVETDTWKAYDKATMLPGTWYGGRTGNKITMLPGYVYRHWENDKGEWQCERWSRWSGNGVVETCPADEQLPPVDRDLL